MGLLDTVRRILTPSGSWGPELVELTTTNEEIEALFGRISGSTVRTYRLPSVKDALSVPAIQSAVALISGTVGMLSVQGYRNGAVMAVSPRLIARPNPYLTPQAFYAGTAADMAKYGEFVWWIAARDQSGFASALVQVPLNELQVTENLADRLRPAYRWGTKTGTRYTPATPEGIFVHCLYPLAEPFAIRGQGPLQLCGAATSVSVEAQAWAAQFYADGGDPSVVIKHAGELSAAVDADGLNEADRLRAQWIEQPHNVPRVIDQNIESVEYKSPSENGAQMLDARQHQNGDAARMFRIPGPLLEYQQAGSSLTYQNRTDLKGELVETCLQPLYLEPIEQVLSDLLPRPIVARFNVKGFLRADAKTRFEVHGIAIDKGIYDAEYAQREEGIIPGDIEYAPVPFSPPAAVPRVLPRTASLRCDGRHTKRHNGVAYEAACGRLLSTTGTFSGVCPRCKKLYPAGASDEVAALRSLASSLGALAAREIPAPVVTVAPAQVTVPVTYVVPEPSVVPRRPVLTRLTYDEHDRITGVLEDAVS